MRGKSLNGGRRKHTGVGLCRTSLPDAAGWSLRGGVGPPELSEVAGVAEVSVGVLHVCSLMNIGTKDSEVIAI